MYFHYNDNVNLTIEELYSTLKNHYDKNEFYGIVEFCVELVNKELKKATDLYNYTLEQPTHPLNFYILSNILINQFLSSPDEIFNSAKKLLSINPEAAYAALGRFEYQDEGQIVECVELSKKALIEEDVICIQIVYLLKSLIENKLTSSEIRTSCFQKIKELFLNSNEKVKDSIFFNIQFLKEYEEERYELFVNTILSKSQNYYSRISDFFYNFSNPEYFFDLYTYLYQINCRNNFRFKVDPFAEAYSHFWDIAKDRTEELTLQILSHDIPMIRLSAVFLLRSSRTFDNCYPIDLLKLEENKQLRATEALFHSCYYDIEPVINLILTLKKSPYKKVLQYLQKKLSELIFESYHGYLLELVETQIKDKSFIKPLKESFNEYKKMCEKKESIKDLNPYDNERDWMYLYRKLESEKLEHTMNKARKEGGSIMSLFKESIIVRGHSWSMEDNDVSPLGLISKSMTVDIRMFKDPDLFNWNYQESNFKSEF